MADSKQSVKNKSRIEGSICAFYLHRETTHFCFHYFNNFMLSLWNTRYEMESENERIPSILSIYDLFDHHSAKKSNHWLTQKKWDLAHV